jgi:hypothetical protein
LCAHDKTWKSRERKIARKLQAIDPEAKRNPLSGRMSKHGTSGDVLSDMFYVEVKTRKKFAHCTLYRDTKVKARKEGNKIPIVVTHETGKKEDIVIVGLKDFVQLLSPTKQTKA